MPIAIHLHRCLRTRDARDHYNLLAAPPLKWPPPSLVSEHCPHSCQPSPTIAASLLSRATIASWRATEQLRYWHCLLNRLHPACPKQACRIHSLPLIAADARRNSTRGGLRDRGDLRSRDGLPPVPEAGGGRQATSGRQRATGGTIKFTHATRHK